MTPGRRRSRIKRFRKRISRSRWFLATLSSAAAFVMGVVAATLRVQWTEQTADGSLREGAPDALGGPGRGNHAGDDDAARRIYAFWHGRLFLLVPAFRDRGIVIITSTSFAGEVLTRVLERFGYATVRGSSGRRGTAALIAMKGALADGRDGGVALDGPSGPERRSKGGAVAAAQSAGCSIVPIGVSASPAWTVPSTWDRFMMPMLFARCSVVVGRPIAAADLGEIGLEELDARVDAMTDEADRQVGR